MTLRMLALASTMLALPLVARAQSTTVLSVNAPFGSYHRGDRITDPATIATILGGPYAGYVVPVGSGGTVTPVPVPPPTVQATVGGVPVQLPYEAASGVPGTDASNNVLGNVAGSPIGTQARNGGLARRSSYRATFNLSTAPKNGTGIVGSSKAATVFARYTLPTTARTVRFCLPEGTATYTVNAVQYVLSSSNNDNENPTTTDPTNFPITPLYATFTNAGAYGSGTLDLPHAGVTAEPAAITVPIAAADPVTGATGVPHPYCTDTMFVPPNPEAIDGQGSILMVRVAYPANGNPFFGQAPNPYSGSSVATGPGAVDEWFSQRGDNDYTTTSYAPGAAGGTTIPSFAIIAQGATGIAFSPFTDVQWTSPEPMETVGIGGDSLAEDSGTPLGVTPFAEAAILDSTTALALIPDMQAYGGTNSAFFDSMERDMLALAKPEVAILQFTSRNDGETWAAFTEQEGRAVATGLMFQDALCRVIYFGGVPDSTFTGESYVMYDAMEHALQRAGQAGEQILDFRPLLAIPGAGTYLPDMSGDATHPQTQLAVTTMLPSIQAAIGKVVGAP